MIFNALTSAGLRGTCWNPSLKGEGFNTSLGASADVIASERHVWSVLLHKTAFSLETLEKLLQTASFTCTYNGAEKHVTCERFENAASRAKTNVIATVHFTDDDVSFYEPRNAYS